MPAFKAPAEIIDINDTNAKVKISNKIKVLNVSKLKLFLEEKNCETDTNLQDLNFKNVPNIRNDIFVNFVNT